MKFNWPSILLYGLITYLIGFQGGRVSANRATMRNAMRVIDSLPAPVYYLNAQDAIAIVGLSATPRYRGEQSGLEQISRTEWVNTKPRWANPSWTNTTNSGF